jgi:SAM-dependent methyltransferase
VQNVQNWRPSKYELRGGKWRASSVSKELAPISTLAATLELDGYLDAIATHAKGHLADFGCGKVPLFGFYRDIVDEVTCIDWPQSLHESPHVDIFADLNEPTAIPDAQFETILSSSVLEHIWNHSVFWDEMARTLKPGGRIILGVPFIYWLHEEPHDYFRWTRFALTRACEERGLKVVSLTAYGGGLDVLADLFVRNLGFMNSHAGNWAARAATWLMTRPIMRRLSNRSASKIPLGYTLVAEKR